VHVLFQPGYDYVVKNLVSEITVDHTYQRRYLKIVQPQLRLLFVPSELLPELYSRDVIKAEDKERVARLENNEGPIAAADLLLEILPTKHIFWYKAFIEALRKVDQTDAADILDIPELLDGIIGEYLSIC